MFETNERWLISFLPSPCTTRNLQPGRELDTEEGARTYLDEHRIYDVLEELFTSLLFSKPEHPLSFIVEESKRLKAIAGVAKGAVR